MVQCPVCQNEYVEGQVSFCCTCEWDMMPYPLTFPGQLPEAFLEKERGKLDWAIRMWKRSQSE